MSSWGKKIFGGFALILDLILSFSRELIAEGTTGGLVIFGDRPNYWDAWGEAKQSDLCHVWM
jgi:hypothetical protein